MKPFTTYPIKIVLYLLATVCGIYLFFALTSDSPVIEQNEIAPVIQKSLDDAEQLFLEISHDFEIRSNELFQALNRDIRSNQSRSFIHNRLEGHNFWGAAIYKNSDLWVWNNFQLVPLLADNNEASQNHARVVNYNNVVLLLHQQNFTFDDEAYTFLTAEKIAQTTNLPFTEFVTYNLSDHPDLKNNFPVHFSFISPVPQNVDYRNLKIGNNDSTGVVYANPEDLSLYNSMQENSHNVRHSGFQAGIFLLLLLIIVFLSRHKLTLLIHALLLLIVFSSWILLAQSGIINNWALTLSESVWTDDPYSAAKLITYGIHSLFLIVIWVITHHLLKFFMNKELNENHYITFTFSILFGVLCVGLFLFFIEYTQSILVESNIPLLDLELAPNAASFIFYLIASIFFTCIGGIAFSVGHYIFQSDDDKSTIHTVLSAVGFIACFYIVGLFIESARFFSWVFLLSSLLFIISMLIINTSHKYSYIYDEMSGFRKLMILTFLASISIYTLIWNSSNSRIDRQLIDRVNSFTTEETADTDQILFNVLDNIEESLGLVSGTEMDQTPSIFQARFQQVAQSVIRDDWKDHSLDLRLLATDESQIGSYSTNIDSPGWSSFFNTDLMLRTYRGERIRQQTNRPIIWGRPANLPDRYTTFSRGWIPIYDADSPNNIVAWLAGDAYIERPDFNKPMRAVLSAATPDNWQQSFYIAEFLGNRLTRSTVEGLYNNQPQYNKLPEQEAAIASRDSIAYITNITASGSFREILVQRDDRKVLKASTPIPPLNQHLFSFVRLQIILVFFGLFVFSLLAMAGLNKFILFGQSRQFKHRLIDGLTLASLLLLTVLIFATQFAVGVQNEKNVERDLINKLNSLGESLRGGIWANDELETQNYLAELTTSLNVDAMIYDTINVSESTTPQIFQQHLMPALMPYPAYDFLYNRERRHYFISSNIGDEKLLIGYRSIVDEDGRPVSTVAIPTFLQSPVYREQLLETTSYLFVVYLAIFGFFIIGTVFLSNQLTKPLKIIQKGLNRISRGEDKTEVAVTSRDEIGSLAGAYNQMVQRLDEAQKELIKAERESAWKEMAQQVAHEIKNPLTPMKLNLQHLQRQLENNPENVLELKPVIEKTAANIIDQIESLNKIASDFSKFAKPVQSSLEKVDLNKLINSVTNLYSHDESTTISVNGHKNPVFVNAAQDDLKRALINLVKNGIEACGTSDAQITISLQKKKSAVILSIQDNGSGIKPNNKEKIFVPNFSTKSSGTGLGLAISKKIIEAHEGEIWFESDNNRGTTFFIKLPLVD